jgi:hypothetical protein
MLGLSAMRGPDQRHDGGLGGGTIAAADAGELSTSEQYWTVTTHAARLEYLQFTAIFPFTSTSNTTALQQHAGGEFDGLRTLHRL